MLENYKGKNYFETLHVTVFNNKTLNITSQLHLYAAYN